MSFRKFGGIKYAAKNNIVTSNYSTSNNLLVTKNVGQTDSYINFLSDISGNNNYLAGEGLNVTTDIDGLKYLNVDSSLNFLNLIDASSINPTLNIGTENANTINMGKTNTNILLNPNGGNVGVNNTTPNYTLDVSGNVNITGNTTVSGTIYSNSFNSTSDYRLKTNIKTLNSSYTIDNLNPVEYEIDDRHDMGFIAHELQQHYSFLVNGEKDGQKLQTVNYNGLIALLVKEVQNLKKDINNLKNKTKESI